MLGDLLFWWLRQMRGLVLALRRKPPEAPDAIIVAIDELRLEPELLAKGAVMIRRDGRETVDRTLDLSQPRAGTLPALPAGLRLPAGMVLHREVSLPLAAERNLGTVIGFEMDRLTPFAADEVFWSSNTLSRHPGPAGLRLNLLIARRDPVDALVAALDRLNLRPSFLENAAGRIDLPAWQPRSRRHWRLASWLLCGVLGLAAVTIPALRQQLALNGAARQIAVLAPSRQEALALRRKLGTAAAGAAVISAAHGIGDVLRGLAALTQALPDGTSLTDLTLKSGDLTFDGRSSNAAALISILAAAPHFQAPAFTAPVTHAIDGKADLFSIHATVAP